MTTISNDSVTRHQAYFDGAWHTTPRSFEVIHPGTLQPIGSVADCTEGDARRAIDAAELALKDWRKVNPYKRGQILRRWHDLMFEHKEQLARLMTLEMGKPITETRGEVHYAASFIEWCAEEASRIGGERVPSRFDHKRGFTSSEPVGIVYAVTPWNFPAGMITRKAAPALAAGCVMILKPAEQSPMTALYLAELWLQAGGPANTLQVVPTNDAPAFSAPFMEDERVRKLTFTGSTAVGRLLYGQAAKTIKRVSLELGGHAPFLVFEDADLECAAREVMASKFRNAGQTCISTNRVYVQRSVAAEFTAILTRLTGDLVLGDPLQDGTGVGPVVEQAGLDKVRAQVEDALARGAKATVGGTLKEGLYFHPTVLTDVHPDSLILREETFGPVAPVVVFDTEDEALALANASEYGLAAYAYTRDLSRAFRVAEALEYGIVGINDGGPSAAAPQMPFGGMKNSGVGREGGHWGLDEYLETKYISMGL
ncbi:NAD-dependent succinate-semialdehyde dehydrogenase [Deinococcus soli (ex Cha et al. 2016)]|uniref:Succinate-semialdehyde dehydrogenase/glutarate-semialdehyde dehydrogenase n=2 Tax=Deinococcus soli (ex Cha et al. 2016) TaxID=1309411 RepID=A0AAE4BMT4_9DEIO|nr:NAD-dependent succinate-semialdehyde dehydrogenase [Deinococcus soli (ex Cha et al. 2016)]MDR6218031.1 succinate-semialdehyde dehydrogenase/glutarate-semialdehyde dehydrogenase [Deinococcus soli (ex Cha et al. 2016)]MDR6328281.1 succinate-semialdehyde dehydrogenase/glutarate-semialdehyde dehydrogenase [Deinococcus soli (ex Cha et al. 2016)]MDR6751133.1 succinate-semialdehyde dehydrogenase/glutarate-semialdehyde dehydrogenase [Deinococcus soli (ex Cha et al. 2016)]